MKSFLLPLFLITSGVALAQSNSTPPEGFVAGHIVTTANVKLDGYIRDNMRKKGEVVLLSADGKKKSYTAAEVTRVLLGEAVFTSIGDEFFRILVIGEKMTLLQKASSVTGKLMYNGAEAVVNNGTEGAIDDYFIATGNNRVLVTRRNFKDQVTQLCVSCTAVTEGINSKQYNYSTLPELVTAFNACR